MTNVEVCQQHPSCLVVFHGQNSGVEPSARTGYCPLCAVLEILSTQDKEMAMLKEQLKAAEAAKPETDDGK